MKMTLNKILLTVAAVLAATVVSAQWQFKLDTTFKTQITQQNVNALHLLLDGRIFLSGRIRFPGDMSEYGSTILLQNGDRDLNYIGFFGGEHIIPCIDGKFYVSNGLPRRMLPNGSIDQAFIALYNGPYFQSGSGGDYHVFEDGRVLITGNHTLSDSIRGFMGQYKLIWFSNEGYLDTTRIHRHANGVMWDFTALPDGKFLCSCSCTQYEGQPVGRVFRIHPDGELDTTFQTDIYTGNIFAYYPLEDGRVMVGGNFRRSSDPDQILQLVRFMPDGSLDPTFNNYMYFGVADGLNGTPKVTNIVHWQDDMFFVMGFFRNVDGETRGGICVVDSSGQLLPLMDDCLTGPFTYMGNTAASVHGITPTPDGNAFYINGTYAGYSDGTINDTLQHFVSRLLVEDVIVAVQEQEVIESRFSIHPNPANGTVTFNFGPLLAGNHSIMIRDLSGRIIETIPINGQQGLQTWNTSGLAPGTYLVEYILGEQIMKTEKLVVQR